MKCAFPAIVTVALPAALWAGFASSIARADAIGFRAGVPSRLELTDHRTGKHYIATVEPDPDVKGTIDGVDLVLTNASGDDQNLLAPFGIYHGLQPYYFVALDLRAGPAKSAFGAIRRIPIRRTATKLVVEIGQADVRDIDGMTKGEAGSAEVKSLRLNIYLDDESSEAR